MTCDWTFAVTDALAFSVNVHVFVWFEPLEQAPDRIAPRPSVTLSVIDVPRSNDAAPVPRRLIDRRRARQHTLLLRPVAVTVSEPPSGGSTVSVVVRVIPPETAAFVTGRRSAAEVDNARFAVDPAGTVPPAGTPTTAGLLLDR